MEEQDHIAVTEYQARFAGTFEVDPSFGDDLYLKKVCVWLVAASTGKFEVTARKDGDDAVRKNIQAVEDAIPLTGVLRDQAIIYLSHGGSNGAVDFGTPTESEIEMDRLQQYLLKSWATATSGRPTPVQLVDEVIELLEAYKNGEAPVSALAQAVASSEVQPAVAGPPASQGPKGPTEEATMPIMTEAEMEEIEARLEAELAEEQGAPAAPMDVAALKAMMGSDDDEVPRGGLKVGKTTEAYQAAPADGEEVMVLGDDHVVIGSVYGPGHSGKNREYIEAVS